MGRNFGVEGREFVLFY